jgi:spore germination protein GerM
MKIAATFLFSFVFLNAGSTVLADKPSENAKTVTVTLHFTDVLVAQEYDCGATLPVKREVQVTDNIIDSTLRLLFKGVTEEEKNKNLSDSFDFNTSDPLVKYYIGVSIEDGVAIVNFREGAMRFLDSPLCMQQTVKDPIEKTLLEFPDIVSVKYAIEGEVVNDFDV